MRLAALAYLAALTLAGCYDPSYDGPRPEAEPQPATTDIRTLCGLFVGTTVPVTGDIVVAGRITANERGGNFYRTLCIEHEGAGMELRAAVDRLDNDFPVGCSVTLRLKGLALGRHYGVLQAGTMPAAGSGYATDCIPSKAALDLALTRNGTRPDPIEPPVVRLAELTPERCGTLVRIEGLRYAPEGVVPGTWSGHTRFVDDTGSELFVYVSPYADFADEEVPRDRRSLTGILQYDDRGEGRFLIKPRDENDCNLP